MSDDEGHTSFRSAHFRDYLSATLQGVPIEQVLLDYFSTSPFYDRTCNNEVCAMQNRARCSEDLKEMEGIQYEVESHKMDQETGSTLSVIRKVRRERNPDAAEKDKKKDNTPNSKTKLLACYYIISGEIYRAPNILNALETRLANALFYMNEGIQRLADDEQQLREDRLENADKTLSASRRSASAYQEFNNKALREIQEKFVVKEEVSVLGKRTTENAPSPLNSTPKRMKT